MTSFLLIPKVSCQSSSFLPAAVDRADQFSFMHVLHLDPTYSGFLFFVVTPPLPDLLMFVQALVGFFSSTYAHSLENLHQSHGLKNITFNNIFQIISSVQTSLLNSRLFYLTAS